METLDDIELESGTAPTETPEDQTDQQETQQPEQPPAIDRRLMLAKPLAASWGGGCGVAVWLTEVPELAANDHEKALAGEHMANILDAIMPEHWLTDFDPDSKAGRILVSGVVMVSLVKAKAAIYESVMAQREAENDSGEESESQSAE